MGSVYEILDCSDTSLRKVSLDKAAQALRRGRAAVVPGESSYLLVSDAFSDSGVARIRGIKGRSNAALAVLVGSTSTVDGIATGIPRYGRDLMCALWPGLLTLVMRQQPSLAWPLTTLKIAVRMPIHPLPLSLAHTVGPIAVSTANRAGMPVAVSAAECVAEFDDDVTLYLDAGPVSKSGRSTVVDITGPAPELIRSGDLSEKHLRDICPALVVAEVT